MKTSTSMMDSARKIVMDYFNSHVDVTDKKQKNRKVNTGRLFGSCCNVQKVV